MNCHLAATLKSLHRSILVIGYGSSLHCDDAIGQQIAQAVAAWRMPNVETIAVHQLIPELVERLAMVDLVIFVDAYPSTASQEIQVRPLAPADSDLTTHHWCDPRALLSITQALYDYHPQAWWVMVPGVNFELGEGRSTVAAQGIEDALQEIEQLMRPVRTEPCMKLG